MAMNEDPIPRSELKIFDEFPVPMATPGRDGQPRHYVNIIGLKTEDGERYGCGFCELTWTGFGFVRRHLGDVHPSNKKSARSRRSATAAPTSVADIFGMFERIEQERDEALEDLREAGARVAQLEDVLARFGRTISAILAEDNG